MRPLVASLMQPLEQAVVQEVALPGRRRQQAEEAGAVGGAASSFAGPSAAAEAGAAAAAAATPDLLQELLIQVYLEPEQYAGEPRVHVYCMCNYTVQHCLDGSPRPPSRMQVAEDLTQLRSTPLHPLIQIGLYNYAKALEELEAGLLGGFFYKHYR
jgi:hypothetical protein